MSDKSRPPTMQDLVRTLAHIPLPPFKVLRPQTRYRAISTIVWGVAMVIWSGAAFGNGNTFPGVMFGLVGLTWIIAAFLDVRQARYDMLQHVVLMAALDASQQKFSQHLLAEVARHVEEHEKTSE